MMGMESRARDCRGMSSLELICIGGEKFVVCGTNR